MVQGVAGILDKVAVLISPVKFAETAVPKQVLGHLN
jgi:hypothetical protein